MFIKEKDGDFVNLESGLIIQNSIDSILLFTPHNSEAEAILFVGTANECQKYMAELEKELAAFGKMVRVEIAEKCTCGNSGKAVWEHDKSCVIWEDDLG